MAENISNGDPSQFFVGGSDFDKAIRELPVSVAPIPDGLASTVPTIQPINYEILIREGLLHAYYSWSNQLINNGALKPPVVHLDADSGSIINPTRGPGIKPQGEGIVPIIPGNEHMTPPPLLVIRQIKEGNGDVAPEDRINGNDWLIRLFPNAYAYGYPRKEVLWREGSKRIETICALSLVAALNTERRKPYDLHYKNADLMELLLYTFSTTSRLIMEHADYLDLDGDKTETRQFDSVLMFINQGKEAGGSLPWPHAQIIAYPRENTQLEYLGYKVDKNGECVRCKDAQEKIGRGSGRIIKKIWHVLDYVPFSQGASKGKAYRVSPTHERHFANFELALSDISTFRTLAQETLFSMFTLAKGQLPKTGETNPKEPSYNVLFAQDCKDPKSHLFIDVQTGNPVGGFGIMVPVYKGMERLIKPVVLYEDPENTARDARANFPV